MDLNSNLNKSDQLNRYTGCFTLYLRNCLIECPRIEATITGVIPLWLKGSLIRNGPGMYQIQQYQYNHIFDFPSLLRKYSVENGKVFYENKFLKSSTYKKNQEKQRIVVTEFGTRRIPDPCRTLFQRFMSYFTFDDLSTDNTVVSFINIKDEIYACSDTTYLLKIDPNNLDTVEINDIRKYISINCLSSHAHTDKDGNVYNLGSSIHYYNIVKIPRNKELKEATIVAKIPIKRHLNPSYYHSFCVTKNYFVFIEQPLVISVPTLITQFINKSPHSDILKWKSKYKNRFYLVSRKDGTIVNQKYISEPFAFFHTINAYEEQNHIVVDICCYNNGNVLKTLYTNAIKETEVDIKAAKRDTEYVASQARRYVLPILNPKFIKKTPIGTNVNSILDSKTPAIIIKHDTIQCIPEMLTDTNVNSLEMPTINYNRCNGKEYRYFYCVCRRHNPLVYLMKCDVKTKATKFWSENYCFPSEPIFVPSPEAIDEDDGVILSSVISEKDEKKGFLLVLDAKTFKEIGRASIEAPSSLPADFHGMFLSH